MTDRPELADIASVYFEPMFPGRINVPETHGGAILDFLALPEHRDALTAWFAQVTDTSAADALEAAEADRLRLQDEEDRCPHCGSEPDDPTNHQAGCPTLDTCAQCEPDLEPPWHPEADWYDRDRGDDFSQALNAHIRDHHRKTR